MVQYNDDHLQMYSYERASAYHGCTVVQDPPSRPPPLAPLSSDKHNQTRRDSDI